MTSKKTEETERARVEEKNKKENRKRTLETGVRREEGRKGR